MVLYYCSTLVSLYLLLFLTVGTFAFFTLIISSKAERLVCNFLRIYIFAEFEKPQAVILEESESNYLDNRIGGTIQLSTYGSNSSHSKNSGVVRATQPKKRGMVLPFEPYSLTFDDVTYSADMPKVKSIIKPIMIFQKYGWCLDSIHSGPDMTTNWFNLKF